MSIAPPPGGRALCSRNVHAGPGGLHLAWSTHAVADEVQVVVAHYERELGATLILHAEPVPHFKLARGEERLSIYAARHHGRFPNCSVTPRPTENTVVLIALATRPS